MRDCVLPPAPVTCEACDADAFALASARENPSTGRIHITLRCGACGRWQHHSLTTSDAERFRAHQDATQRQIARVLAAMLRAAAVDR